jgi:hypothetical protein
MQGIEHSHAVRAADGRLSVDCEGHRPQLRRGASDGWISIGPVIASASEQAHGPAVTADNQPVGVIWISWTQAGPAGGFVARVGIHG